MGTSFVRAVNDAVSLCDAEVKQFNEKKRGRKEAIYKVTQVMSVLFKGFQCLYQAFPGICWHPVYAERLLYPMVADDIVFGKLL